ncbi:MAG: prepilin-type N-terminal cleavage/methylation domain-containing protein [Cyanobium sp.]
MKRAAGFTLAELLVALALALVVTGVVVQGLITAGRSGERLALLLRERAVQRRTLAMLREELAAAQRWRPATGLGATCSLGGRAPVLQLEVEGRWITYSLGAAPSPIWRGQVLMRCGPAYGLGGELSSGAAQNRVLLDGLAPGGLEVEEEAPGVMRLKLRQAFPLRSGGQLPISLEMRAPAPSG